MSYKSCSRLHLVADERLHPLSVSAVLPRRDDSDCRISNATANNTADVNQAGTCIVAATSATCSMAPTSSPTSEPGEEAFVVVLYVARHVARDVARHVHNSSELPLDGPAELGKMLSYTEIKLPVDCILTILPLLKHATHQERVLHPAERLR